MRYSSPVVSGSTVYVDGSNGSVAALDAPTGGLRWDTTLPPPPDHTTQILYPSPTVADGVVYVAASYPAQLFARARAKCHAASSAESISVVTRERRRAMTGKADFTQEEWELVLEGPPSAGMIVVTAQRGGTFRESIAMAKAYVEARRQHGESELLDEIVAAKPERDHTRYHSVEELKQHGLQHLRDAAELLERKATPEEVEAYRRFVLTLADRVANAHREGGEAVSDAERAAIEEIAASVGKTDR